MCVMVTMLTGMDVASLGDTFSGDAFIGDSFELGSTILSIATARVQWTPDRLGHVMMSN
jgi:hypothetical protein